MLYQITRKKAGFAGLICEAAPRRGRFAPLASLGAAQRINVARFARWIPTLNDLQKPSIPYNGLGGQTASEVIFDLRIELADLKNHIATNKRPWPLRSRPRG